MLRHESGHGVGRGAGEASLADQLKADLRAAMRARESGRVATLRTIVAALDNATAVPVEQRGVPMEGHTPDVPRRELSAREQLDIVRTEAEGRRTAALHYEQLGKLAEAARLRAELEVIAAYLDEQDVENA